MVEQTGIPTYILVPGVALICLILWKIFGKRLQKRLFVWLYSGMIDRYNALFNDFKTKHFHPLHEMKSLDENCRKEGILRVLEIGVGQGANFKYYPENISLLPLDPNKNFESYFKKNCHNFPNVKVKQFINECAEDMASVPDHSVDVVVSTLVLCSVQDINAVVREAKRVLAPGGKFFFFEHMIDQPGTRLRSIQNVVNALGIWQFVFDNCNINRKIDEQMEVATKLAGFSDLWQEKFCSPPNNMWVLYFVKPHVRGVATS